MGKKRNMPYVRTEYISGAPGVKVRFKVGGGQHNFVIKVVSEQDALVSQEALEAARVAINIGMQRLFGEGKYMLVVKPFPHVILREHKMLTGAGADRLSEGMRRAFGKPTSRAARISKGQTIFEVYVSDVKDWKATKEAVEKGLYKLPVKARIISEEIKVEQQ